MADRRQRFSTADQVGSLVPVLVAWGAGTALLALVLARGPDRTAELLLDPADTAHLPWYTGLVSNLGVVAWSVGAACAACGAMAARAAGRSGAATFLRSGAVLVTLLLLDDLFGLHSWVLHGALGVPEVVGVGVSALLTVAWVTSNIAEIRRTRWKMLALAGAALAASALVDHVLAPTGEVGLLAEDGAKFLGVLAVATYFAVTTRDIVGSLVRAGEPADLPTTERNAVDRS